MSTLVLSGLQGKNPLGFMAALGVLDAVEARVPPGRPRIRMAWKNVGSYVPVLTPAPTPGELLDWLRQDIDSFREEPAIQLLKLADGSHDLKPPPDQFRSYLEALLSIGSERSLRFACAFATDVAKDNKGNTKPTALHFTAGTQRFLSMATRLIHEVSDQDIAQGVFGPWRYDRPLPCLQWDNGVSRDYAFHAEDPGDGKQGVPGAEWLAFRGLSYFATAPAGDSIQTTACVGGWKSGAMRWPIWTVPVTSEVVRSLLSSPDLLGPSAMERLAPRGVAIVFEATIRRAEQGGRGTFRPARVL